MATSDEQFGGPPPYHPGMTSLPAAELLRLAVSDPARSPAGPCFDEMALARIADGLLPGSERPSVIAHLAGCGACRRRLASLVALLDDPEIRSEAARHRGGPRPALRPVLAVLGLAAAAVLAVVFVPPRGPEVLRDQAITLTPAPSGVAPVGEVRQAGALTWGRVDGATGYRATLFDSAGTVLFEARVTDTSAVVPDSVGLQAGRTYFWKVEARTRGDRWSGSQLYRFRISAEPGSRNGAADLREEFRRALAEAVRGDSSSRAKSLERARRIAASYQAAHRDDFLVREADRFAAWDPGRRATKVWADSVRLAGNTVYGRDGPRAAIAVWRRALERARSLPDSAVMAALLGNIGAALARESEPVAAGRYLGQALALAEGAGDLRVAANAVSELAGLSEARGDPAAARAEYARAIELRKRMGDARGLARDYNNAASLSRAAGDLDGARRQLEAALALNRREGQTGSAATNLVNLASLAAEAGAFERAEKSYREALAAWRSRGDSAESASALSGLGLLEVRRGDYPAAADAFASAAAILDRTGPAVEALAARQRLASVRAARGELQEATDELERARGAAEALRLPPGARAGLALARADLAVALNRHAEAETHYGAAARFSGLARDPAGVAAARHGLGMLHLARGEPGRALVELEAAVQTQAAAGDRRGAAITRIALGAAAAAAGDTAAARSHLSRAALELDRLRDPVGAAAALVQQAELEAGAGRWAAAESLNRTARVRLGRRPAPEVAWRIHAGLAEARAHFGDTIAAIRQLRSSIAVIEAVGSTLRLPERRSILFEDKWLPYRRLAALELARGRVDASFAASEALRAREMAELLALGRVAAPSDTAGVLVAREQDLRRRIGELARTVTAAAPEIRPVRGPDAERTGTVSREALLEAQEAYAALRLEIRERAPRLAGLVAPEPVSWRSIARRLGRREVLLEYLLGESASYVYVVTRDTLVGIPLGVSGGELARRVEFLRGALEPRDAALDSLWRAPLRKLHRDLIGPVESRGLLRGKTRLTIVPHAELHYLPFAALVASEGPPRFLVERYEIALAPSASVWLALGRERGRENGAKGALALAPHPGRLPASRREIAALARTGRGEVRVLEGRAASEAAFAQEAPGRRLIHLATYGVLNKPNPLFSYVDLAPGGRHDGRLEAHEVFGHALDADLVVLAACRTALGSGAGADVPPGDDWVGLAQAFLTAGAAQVLASLWAVEDRATGTLMQRFYERYAPGADPARTLAEAQRSMLARPATAHPYHWAAFEVIGGRRAP